MYFTVLKGKTVNKSREHIKAWDILDFNYTHDDECLELQLWMSSKNKNMCFKKIQEALQR